MRHATVCITTINKPKFIEDIIFNAKKYSFKDYNVIIIGDYKSPAGNKDYILNLKRKHKVDLNYLDVGDQKKILEKYKRLNSIIPYNWGGRKMLANFLSIKYKSDITIQIDDDNFIQNNNFFQYHSQVGCYKKIPLYSSNNKWFNIYSSLKEKSNIPIFPRGFLQKKRFETNTIKKYYKKIKIASCNGLVLNDPDIDAFSRLFWPIQIEAVKKKFLPNFGLMPGTWSTWNNQNTSTYLDLTKIYFTPHCVGRNADIWTSMVICKIASHLNEAVTFGQPIVKQNRNPHSLMKDYDEEKLCNLFNEDFYNLLINSRLTKNNYLDCMKELIYKCEKQLSAHKKEVYFNFIRNFFLEYKIWINEVSKLN